MSTMPFWFRSDFRLWRFRRTGPNRCAWWAFTVNSLRQTLQGLGCARLTCTEPADFALPSLAHAVRADKIVCEAMRRVTLNGLVHDLTCDWRVGAAWFEHQLLDDHGYGDQGNWRHIPGHGIDPHGGRHFAPKQQAADRDSDGVYQRLRDIA